MGEAALTYLQNDDLLVTAVAEAWLGEIAAANRAGRRHLVALSGGRVAKKLFTQAAIFSRQQGVSFDRVEFFWADERCVPPGDAESNFRLANENLFRPLRIKSQSIHRIQGELTPTQAAEAAAEDLIQTASGGLAAMPVFDLILLGMGEDGHVASLFPRDPITTADRTSVYLPINNSPKPPAERVTLGNGPLYAARLVWVLASGSGKEVALRESLSPSGSTPLARVIKNRSQTLIFTDIPHSWAARIT